MKETIEINVEEFNKMFNEYLCLNNSMCAVGVTIFLERHGLSKENIKGQIIPVEWHETIDKIGSEEMEMYESDVLWKC